MEYTRTLKLTSPMMYGDDVTQLQTRLNELGFDCGTVDGWFGQSADSAVKTFQSRNDLIVDGIVGPATWNALFGDSRILKLTSPQMYGADVKEVQSKLNELGYNCGAVDGWFGPATDSAVRSFQLGNNLTVDGKIGPATWNELFKNTRVLKLTSPMMNGDDVKEVQTRLNQLGYNCGVADGWFSSTADSAVRSFQSDNGLTIDGIVGPGTWNALFSDSRILKLASPQMHGDDVTQLQTRLNELEFDCGTVDGWFGPATDSAVRTFQSQNGLIIDGIVGPNTWESIFSSSAVHNTGDPSTSTELKKIFIDAGHGGSDPGAIGYDLREKDITLAISLEQKKLFEEAGYEVMLSRSNDSYVSLSQRTDMANSWGADLFISNHVNAGGGKGSEVWCSIYGGEGREYANKIAPAIGDIFGYNRGIKTREGSNGDYYHVIREASMPSIIIEHGFIDNFLDNALLKYYQNLCILAQRTFQSITMIYLDDEDDTHLRNLARTEGLFKDLPSNITSIIPLNYEKEFNIPSPNPKLILTGKISEFQTISNGTEDMTIDFGFTQAPTTYFYNGVVDAQLNISEIDINKMIESIAIKIGDVGNGVLKIRFNSPPTPEYTKITLEYSITYKNKIVYQSLIIEYNNLDTGAVEILTGENIIELAACILLLSAAIEMAVAGIVTSTFIYEIGALVTEVVNYFWQEVLSLS